MKTIKRITCTFLAFAILIGLTACAPKTFEHKKLAKFCQKQGFEELDKAKSFCTFFSGSMYRDNDGEGAYAHLLKREAQKVYDEYLKYSTTETQDYDVTEVTAFVYVDEDMDFYGFLYTFENEREAKKSFNNYGIHYITIDGKGKEETYSYYIANYDNYRDMNVYEGVYLKGNTLLIVECVCDDSDMVDAFCKIFGVISPSDA